MQAVTSGHFGGSTHVSFCGGAVFINVSVCLPFVVLSLPDAAENKLSSVASG